MSLAPGTKLGPYEIQSQLGAGGMGEVYRARDTRLERDVAVKVLPANLSADPTSRQRMEREAKAVSKLSHPQLSSGQIHTICDAPSGRGGTWNKDGVIVFAPKAAGGLYWVSASGGTAMLISDPDKSRGEQSQRWPVFLPDGKHYLYTAINFSGRKGVDGIFLGLLDTNEKRLVVEATANAAYAAPGYLLFYRDKTLVVRAI